MNTENQITVRACKHNGDCYRWWTSTLVAANDNGVIIEHPAGTTVHQPHKTWITKQDVRGYYWHNKWNNLLEFWESGQLKELYVNIASPAVLKDSVLTYVDYELDVVKPTGKVSAILDEDEFQSASFAYDRELTRRCREACSEAVNDVEQWVAGQSGLASVYK